MAWEIEAADEFQAWWAQLSLDEQKSVGVVVDLLEEFGPALKRPYADTIATSRYPNMKELRIQHAGEPYRVLFAFDPRRTAILLIGGAKTGDERWYERNVPLADKIYERYLEEIRKEGLIP